LLLRFFVHSSLFPEVLMIPRGLITIVLLYIIPQHLQLGSFNTGILFFVVLVTSLIMMAGLMLAKTPKQVNKNIEPGVASNESI